MPKKKEVQPEVQLTPPIDEPRVKPSKIEFNFPNGDLNVLRDKLNELIEWVK